MIAPAAHTSKGLAKAFVSSAGGKGPDLLSLQIKTSGPSSLVPRRARLRSRERRTPVLGTRRSRTYAARV
jgi:hypothetical protein